MKKLSFKAITTLWIILLIAVICGLSITALMIMSQKTADEKNKQAIISAVESNMALGMEMKSINPRWKAPRYSFILRALPIGSIALRNPESTNRIPNRKRHMASKNFIPTAFSSEQLLYLFPYIGKYICRRKHFPFCILTMNPYKTVIGLGLFKIHLPYMDLEPDIGLMNVLLAV